MPEYIIKSVTKYLIYLHYLQLVIDRGLHWTRCLLSGATICPAFKSSPICDEYGYPISPAIRWRVLSIWRETYWIFFYARFLHSFLGSFRLVSQVLSWRIRISRVYSRLFLPWEYYKQIDLLNRSVVTQRDLRLWGMNWHWPFCKSVPASLIV